MKSWLRQGIWLAVALIVPLLLSLALLPLRGHVSDVRRRLTKPGVNLDPEPGWRRSRRIGPVHRLTT